MCWLWVTGTNRNRRNTLSVQFLFVLSIPSEWNVYMQRAQRHVAVFHLNTATRSFPFTVNCQERWFPRHNSIRLVLVLWGIVRCVCYNLSSMWSACISKEAFFPLLSPPAARILCVEKIGDQADILFYTGRNYTTWRRRGTCSEMTVCPELQEMVCYQTSLHVRLVTRGSLVLIIVHICASTS